MVDAMAVPENEGVVLPKINDSFLVSSEYPDINGNTVIKENSVENESEKSKKKTRQERNVVARQGGSRSKFLIRSRKEPQAFSNAETNGVHVPKTVTGGTTIKPTGFARRMAETRSQELLSLKNPPKSIKSDTQSQKRPKTKQPLHSPENGTKDNESVDSGIVSSKKGGEVNVSGVENGATTRIKDGRATSSSSQKSSIRKIHASNPKRQQPVRKLTNANKPPSPPKTEETTEMPDLQKEDSGLRSGESQQPSPEENAQNDRGLFYDKQGNLVLRDRKLYSVMSDPVKRKHNSEGELKKIYVDDANLLVSREDKMKKARESKISRPETILTRREANVWDDIHGIYGYDVKRSKKKRHNRFLTRLEQMQLDAAKEHNQKVIDSKIRSFESKQRQQVQLWMVRNRFQEEQERRFNNQWVTMKSLQHEKCDRHVYGLPEDIFGEPENAVRLNRKQPTLIKTFDYRRKREQNIEAYKHFLDINAGVDFDRSRKIPNVEPPDNVEVNVRTHSGVRWKEDERKMKEILRDAKQELRAEISTPPPVETDAPQGRTRKPERQPPQKTSTNVKPKVIKHKQSFQSSHKRSFQSTHKQPPSKAVVMKENNASEGNAPNRRSNIKFKNPRDQKVKEYKKPPSPKEPSRRTLEIPDYKARERRIPSVASVRTVDFYNDSGSETGSQLDAFEKARIKYNLYMDSDTESVA